MTTALIGLGGVVVGVVLTGAVSYWIESGRRSKAAEVSARLIADDFAYAKAAVEAIAAREMWVRDAVTELISIEQWRAERASFAAQATYQDWREVAITTRTLALLAGFHSQRVQSDTLLAPLSSDEREALDLAARHLPVALPILEKYAGAPPQGEAE